MTNPKLLNRIRIASRALVVRDQCLLFVSNDGVYWYPPGGQVEVFESLPSCVVREVFEETGLIVTVGGLQYVQECFDFSQQIHKLHFYFRVEAIQGELNPHWQDMGGDGVKYCRFFSVEEIQANSRIVPRFLADSDWLSPPAAKVNSIYQDLVHMKGFEILARDVDAVLS